MKGMLPAIIWTLAAVALLVSFWLDFANTAQGGAIDLRNRITGARLMEAGMNAYSYKWHGGDPAEFCDLYNNPKLPVSKTTATPAMLILHAPLSALPYRPAQLLWLAAQWALLLGTGWLWLRACAMPWQRWLVVAAVTGFTYTASWRLHAERGQAYVLLAFLFAWWLTATLDPKRGNGFIAGFLAGMLVMLRPPFALLLPFLALHRRGQWLGAAVGLLLGLGLPMFWSVSCWPDYFSAMQTHAELYLHDFDPRPGPQSYPPTIEGIPTDILGNYVAIPYADFSTHALLRWVGFGSFPAVVPMLGMLGAFACWVWLSRHEATAQLLPGLAAWIFLVDLFLPAYRDSYNDVLILNAVAAGVIVSSKLPWAMWPCAFAVPIGWAVYEAVPERAWLINLPAAIFTLSAMMFVLWPDRRKGRQ